MLKHFRQAGDVLATMSCLFLLLTATGRTCLSYKMPNIHHIHHVHVAFGADPSTSIPSIVGRGFHGLFTLCSSVFLSSVPSRLHRVPDVGIFALAGLATGLAARLQSHIGTTISGLTYPIVDQRNDKSCDILLDNHPYT
jgi:hypothetical protein